MANICINSITFTGEDAFNKISKYVDQYEENFLMGKVVPVPTHVPESEQVDWQRENWGSNWEPTIYSFCDMGDGSVELICETAWRPSDKGFLTLCKNETLKMEAEWASEDYTYAGKFSYDGEKFTQTRLDEDSAYEMYKDLFNIED